MPIWRDPTSQPWLCEFVGPLRLRVTMGISTAVLATALVHYILIEPRHVSPMLGLVGTALVALLLVVGMCRLKDAGPVANQLGTAYIGVLSLGASLVIHLDRQDPRWALPICSVAAALTLLFTRELARCLADVVVAFIPPALFTIADLGTHDVAMRGVGLVGAVALAVIVATQATRIAVLRLEARIGDLETRAMFDRLTGLLNRATWEDVAAQRLHELQSDGRPASLIFLDLDGFKDINDNDGHAQGDAALANVGQILRSVIGPESVAGRFGGDEFVVLHADDWTKAERVCDLFLATLAASGVGVKASVGFAAALPEESLARLVRRADLLMLRHKARSRALRLAESPRSLAIVPRQEMDPPAVAP